MMDISNIENGLDMGLTDTVVMKAANVASIQQGSLEYIPDFGVDLKYFLESEFQFQNESFKAYLIERLVHHQVNVYQISETIEQLYQKLTFNVGSQPNLQGFIR